MKKFFLALLVSASCLLFAADKPTTKTTTPDKIERGRYLVNNVGMCADCHSPRNERGEEIAGKALQGADMPFKPPVDIPWATHAPALAGLPNYNEEQVAALLTGKLRKDIPLRPPMPEYRLTEEDARAVAAYLKSLKAPSK